MLGRDKKEIIQLQAKTSGTPTALFFLRNNEAAV